MEGRAAAGFGGNTGAVVTDFYFYLQKIKHTMARLKLLLFAFIVLVTSSATFHDIELVKHRIYDKFTIKIPKTFDILPDSIVRIKYPNMRNPQLIYSNKESTINVGFNHTKSPASQAQIGEMRGQLVSALKASNKNGEWLGDGIETIHGRQVGYANFISPAFDSKIFNLMFFTDVDGRVMIGTFNCMEKDIPEWKDVAWEIMRSMEVE
jgi:hypothetical protein